MATISVVMAVYNGAPALEATLDSILAQSESDFELIVVDDGSTDATPAILTEAAARDARVRVLTQPNAGLTRALIRGCAAATGGLIARHDCGDVSHRDRLRRQREVFDGDPEVVLASCHTRYLGPGNEPLYEAVAAARDVQRSLLTDDVDHIRGLTHHGSAMFRRTSYEEAGGYRAAFGVAQDLDLWIRLAKLGRIAVVPEVLYEARIDVQSISGRRRRDQLQSARIALALRDERDERRRAQLLDAAATIGRARPTHRSRAEAQTLYFIASCLRRARNPAWRGYARSAVRRDPFLLRGWLLLLRWR